MKKIYSLLLLSLLVQSVWSQSGEGYDPENPGDPDVYYTLMLEASPRSGGTVNSNDRQKLSAGQSTYVNASPRLGYEFKRWMMGDSVVSTNSSFSFTMPEKDVVLTAYFEWNPEYNPQNPGDPNAEGYSHHVYVYASPSAGGYFNSSSFTLVEGKTANIYAYPREGYRFESWMCNGEVVSTDNPLNIKMGTADIAYTATFVYNPVSPGEPSPNVFNTATGEVIIDNFTPGSLNSAIYTAVGSSDNYSLVQSILVIGRMTSNDFGFARSYRNCSLIDLSRTTGYTEVPSWSFEGAEALKELYLPMNVEKVGENAFKGCTALKHIYLYATIPPMLAESALEGLGKSVTLHVPSASVALYAAAEGWSELTIQSLDENEKSITVSLPGASGEYKNMTLELQNMQSGQVYRCLVTDRTSYTFFGLMKNTYYNIYLKNSNGVVLGEINNVALENDNLSVSLSNIHTMQDVTLSVTTPDGKNVTADVTITWLDELGSYLRQGNKVSELLTGTNIQYRVKLSKELAMEYVQPKDVAYQVKNGGNAIVLTLSPIKQITMSGYVKDVATKQGISGATVSISQTLNGKYSKTIIAKTDSKGYYTATVYNAPTSLAISAYDYVNQTTEVAIDPSAENVTVDDIAMASIIGTTINISLTYTPSVAEGVTAETQNWYDDYQNVAYSIYNLTTDKEVTQVSNRYPQLVVLDGAREGDLLEIKAISKKKAFKDVMVELVADAITPVDVVFPIKELGGIRNQYKNNENLEVVGMLYDSNGYLKKVYNYANDATLSISGLQDGNYTLITMGKSNSYNSIYNLSRLKEILLEDEDYQQSQFSVESGVICTGISEQVPFFDENKFKYIDKDLSYFNVSQTSLVEGNYQTFIGHVETKDVDMSALSNIKYIVDLPPSAVFVENSVMIGSHLVDSYTLEDNTLTILCPYLNKDNVKFCVIPTESGTYLPSATIAFTVDDRETVLSIGCSAYEVKDMSISVPSITAKNSISVSGTVGTAALGGTVEIYDNDVLIGQTNAQTNGTWQVTCELNESYNLSIHSIYAKVKTGQGMGLLSETKMCMYDINSIQVSKVHMLYNSSDLVFDFLNPSTSNSGYYSFVPSQPDFTFTVDFTDNDTTKVSNVVVYAKTSNNTWIPMKASYNESKHCWVASGKFYSSSLPVNVSVDFTAMGVYDYTEAHQNEIENIVDQLEECYNKSNSESDASIIDLDDNGFSYYYMSEESADPILCKVQLLDYESTMLMLHDKQFYYSSEESQAYYYEETESTASSIFVDMDNTLAFELTLSIEEMNSTQRRVIPVIAIAGLAWKGYQVYDFLKPYWDWYQHKRFFDELLKTAEMRLQNAKRSIDRLKNLKNARCSNGSQALSNNMIDALQLDIDRLTNKYNDTVEKTADFLHGHNRDLLMMAGLTAGQSILSIFAGRYLDKVVANSNLAKSRIGNWLQSFTPKYYKKEIQQSMVNNFLSNALGVAYDKFVLGVPGKIIDVEKTYEKVENEFLKYIGDFELEIYNEASELENIAKKASRCPIDDENNDKGGNHESNNNDKKYGIDPSGYVYEGVSSNRLQGVTATAYYMETTEDMFGVLHDEPKVWDAEEYAQENPLFTDENGMYQWFVPQGLWQVKFEKEGYETTYSEWLPVPPPQLEVNIGMVQSRQPEVKQTHAYKDGIEVEFDKYMLPALLNTENILVSQRGEYVEGEVRLLNEETAYADENVKYASKVRFVPKTPFTASEVTLTVANRVKSYAGLQMQDSYQQTFDIEQELTEIKAEPTMNVPYESEKTLIVQVLPAEASAGKTLNVKTSSQMIASVASESYVLDKDGKAEITITGELPGSASLTYTIDGYDLTARTAVTVDILEGKVVREPQASLASGSSVYRGTTVTLSSEEGHKIWYTLDGSCPCDENGTRKLYTNPLTIDNNITIKMIAEDSEGDVSEVVTLTYSILQSMAGVALNEGWNWVSFNMKNDEVLASTNTALASGTWTASDIIKDDKYVDMYSANHKQWVGTMSNRGALNNTQMYKVHSSKAQTLGLTGEAVNPAVSTITVGSGWNYISYLPLTNMNVSDALKNYRAENGDVIKSQDAFATYSTTNGWEGNLTTMTVGCGYMLKRATNATQATFTYPVEISGAYAKATAPTKSYRYADNMNIVGIVEDITIEDGDSIVAYINGEIRGANRLEKGKNVYLTIQGDDEVKVTLVLVRDGEIIGTANNRIDYKSNNVLGTGDEPTAIKFITDNQNNDSNIGNIKAIYSINGIKMSTRHLNNVPKGTYIIYSEKNGNTCVTKFSK